MSEKKKPDREVDARNLLCPLPILRAEAAIGEMESGEILSIRATDPGLYRDLPAWCRVNEHRLLGINKKQGRELIGMVEKG